MVVQRNWWAKKVLDQETNWDETYKNSGGLVDHFIVASRRVWLEVLQFKGAH